MSIKLSAADTESKKASELAELITLHESSAQEFTKRLWNDAVENKRFRKGRHYTEDQEKEIEAEDLQPYSMPIAATKVSINISQQMANRNKWKALGRGNEDELNAEIKTSIMDFVDEDNDFGNVESDVYSDATGTKYGVVKRYTDYSKNAKGRIVIKRLPYNQVMWDLNCKDFNIPRFANWMQEFEYFTRQQLKEMNPDKIKMLDEVSDSSDFSTLAGDDTYINWFRTDRGQQQIKRVTHYQRKYKTVYSCHYDDGSCEMMDEDPEEMNDQITKDGAEENGENEIKQMPVKEMPGYMKEGIDNYKKVLDETVGGVNAPEMGKQMPKKLLKSIPRIVEYIEAIEFIKCTQSELKRYTLGYDDIEGKFIESDMHCLHPCFNFFDDGDVVCLMDFLKNPQRFLDRITSQIDRSMSKMIKSSYTIVKALMEQESIDDWDNIATALASGGATVMVKEHGAISPINSGNIVPELFTMWKMAYQILEDLSGGKNNQGLKESANESGKAVEKRQEAAYMISYLYIDNLYRWKKTLGEGLMENIDEVYGDDMESTFRVLGDSMSKDVIDILKSKNVYEDGDMPYGFGYINLKGLEKKLGETKVDIIISRSASTPLQKDRKLAQLTNWYQMKAANGEPTPPLSLMFPYTDIDPTVKASIIKWEEEQKAEKAAMMEMQKKQMEFKGHMELAKQATDAAKAQDKPEVKEEQPVNGMPGNPRTAGKLDYLIGK